MFFAFFSISPDTTSAPEIPGQPTASLWKRNVEVFRQTSVRGWQSGKNFFWLGLVWSGSECVIEKVRERAMCLCRDVKRRTSTLTTHLTFPPLS